MNSKKTFYILAGIIALLAIGLVAGAYGGYSLLQGQSKKLVANRLKVSQLQDEQVELTKAKSDIKKYKSLAEIAKVVVPQDKDQAQAVREIVKIASTHNIVLSSITFPASLLGTAPGTVGAATSTKPQLSQLKPVKGITGVYDLAITVQSDQNQPVPYSNFLDFLQSLEQNRRTALINGITILPGDKDPSKVSFTLVLDEYIKP